jgi:uncharacterized RDD family membrane protein YckC
MSELSQGPDWWLAADGKWYPPQLHPSIGPPPPPPASMFQASVAGLAAAAPPAWGAGVSGGFAGTTGWAQPVVGDVDPVLGLRLAPWWKRLIAILIDNLILGLGVFLIVLIIGIAAHGSNGQNSGTSSSSNTHGAALLAGLVILWVLVSIPIGLYFAIMNGARRGQTVGKMALSIAVRDARTGGKVGFWRGFGRFMITVVFSILLYIPYLIDSLSPLWDKRNQSWHDKITHTIVVDLKP